jgi:predicted transglutaminase-like cysteine proteinase
VSKPILYVAIFAALSVGACAQVPQEPSSINGIEAHATRPIIEGPTTAPPPGFVGFCMRSPQACATPQSADATKIAIDDKTTAVLIAVNDRVNNSIVYEADETQFNVANRWTLDAVGGRGDCKDYALAKREALRAAGLPDSALRIAIVRTQGNELHAVLTVETEKGALVLDSLTPRILPWSDTPYRWLMRQAADSPLHWVRMADGGDYPTTSILAGRDQAF